MIRESQEDFLATLKSHAPDLKQPLASVRKDLSAFYAGMQEETVMGSDHHIEGVAITDGLRGIWVSLPESLTERVVLFFHGGGFTTGSTDSHLGLCIGSPALPVPGYCRSITASHPNTSFRLR